MDFLSSTILSGFLYDMLKNRVAVSAENIKLKLKDWAVNELVAPALSEEVNKLNLNNEMSESAIEKRINQNPNLIELLTSIKNAESSATIIQHHSGKGDNIGRDKIIK
ncbi:MAG: hypothetical protein A2097_07505 [Desulfobacula sp. GWF2_41_7]|nr:MAG: hypothetical protein A2097_07505 [Desulfobacula sp. GWF2_41_7]